MVNCLSIFRRILCKESIKKLAEAINGNNQKLFIYIPDRTFDNKFNVIEYTGNESDLQNCAKTAYDHLRVGSCYNYIDKEDWETIQKFVRPPQSYRSTDLGEYVKIK